MFDASGCDEVCVDIEEVQQPIPPRIHDDIPLTRQSEQVNGGVVRVVKEARR